MASSSSVPVLVSFIDECESVTGGIRGDSWLSIFRSGNDHGRHRPNQEEEEEGSA